MWLGNHRWNVESISCCSKVPCHLASQCPSRGSWYPVQKKKKKKYTDHGIWTILFSCNLPDQTHRHHTHHHHTKSATRYPLQIINTSTVFRQIQSVLGQDAVPGYQKPPADFSTLLQSLLPRMFCKLSAELNYGNLSLAFGYGSALYHQDPHSDRLAWRQLIEPSWDLVLTRNRYDDDDVPCLYTRLKWTSSPGLHFWAKFPLSFLAVCISTSSPKSLWTACIDNNVYTFCVYCSNLRQVVRSSINCSS